MRFMSGKKYIRICTLYLYISTIFMYVCNQSYVFLKLVRRWREKSWAKSFWYGKRKCLSWPYSFLQFNSFKTFLELNLGLYYWAYRHLYVSDLLENILIRLQTRSQQIQKRFLIRTSIKISIYIIMSVRHIGP